MDSCSDVAKSNPILDGSIRDSRNQFATSDIHIYITLISITGWYKTPMSQVMGGPFIIHLSWSNMKDYVYAT